LSGRRVLGNALQAGDLPDPAAALERPPKPMVLQHRQHRPRWVGKAPKAASGQPHHQVERPVEGTRERVVGGIAEDQAAPGMVGGRAHQARIVRVTAHHPVQDHQVGRLDRPRILGEVVEAPVEPPLNAGLLGQLKGLLLVGGGELQVLGPRRARLQQLDLELRRPRRPPGRWPLRCRVRAGTGPSSVRSGRGRAGGSGWPAGGRTAG
jgi:hypothetical protein